jgi:DNA-binding MarR family transcriptional regulator
MGIAAATHPYASQVELLQEPVAHEPARLSIPAALLYCPDRDFTALEIRVWSLLDSGSVQEVQHIAQRLGVHRGSVSRALGHLVSHGFAHRKRVQYRNPRTGTYEVLVYAALDGQRAPENYGSPENRQPRGDQGEGDHERF